MFGNKKDKEVSTFWVAVLIYSFLFKGHMKSVKILVFFKAMTMFDI